MCTHFDLLLCGFSSYDSVTIYADSFVIRSGEFGDLVWFENDSGYAACFPLAYIHSIFRLDPGSVPVLCYCSDV